jgi:hypothetical protein
MKRRYVIHYCYPGASSALLAVTVIARWPSEARRKVQRAKRGCHVAGCSPYRSRP